MPKKADPLVGKRIVDVSPMQKHEMSAFGWDSPGVRILLKDGTKIYASQDPEGNGPGTIFGEAPPGTMPEGKGGFYIFGDVNDKELLYNRMIIDMRPMTDAELERQAWDSHERATVIVLDDKATLFPSRDDEGNGAGVWFVESKGRQEVL